MWQISGGGLICLREFFWILLRKMWRTGEVVVELQPSVHVWVCVQARIGRTSFVSVCARYVPLWDCAGDIFSKVFHLFFEWPMRSDSNRKSSSLDTSLLVLFFSCARFEKNRKNSSKNFSFLNYKFFSEFETLIQLNVAVFWQRRPKKFDENGILSKNFFSIFASKFAKFNAQAISIFSSRNFLNVFWKFFCKKIKPVRFVRSFRTFYVRHVFFVTKYTIFSIFLS